MVRIADYFLRNDGFNEEWNGGIIPRLSVHIITVFLVQIAINEL